MVADILVVDGDPLTDITALERIALLIHNGAVEWLAIQPRRTNRSESVIVDSDAQNRSDLVDV